MAQDQCGQGESQDLSGFREGGERGALPRPFAPLHTEEQKNLLNNHSFLKDNCRAQANDSQSGGLSFLRSLRHLGQVGQRRDRAMAMRMTPPPTLQKIGRSARSRLRCAAFNT